MMMDVVVVEALQVLARWLHVIAGITWIGSSFYFIALDLSLRQRLQRLDDDDVHHHAAPALPSIAVTAASTRSGVAGASNSAAWR